MNDENNLFQSQSETILERLVEYRHMTREQAFKCWFNSATYKEILRRRLTYISAMRAYTELDMELNHDPLWFKKLFN